MDERTYYLKARRQSSIMGWSLLVYYNMLTQLVSLVAISHGFILGFQAAMGELWGGGSFDIDTLTQTMTDALMTNFWGYIFAIAVGTLILYCWKGSAYWREELFATKHRMSVGSFFALLAFVTSAQLVVQIVTPVQEWILNHFGLSAIAALESATINGNSLSMFLYISFLGPISEELLFRGLVLRTMQPFGKQNAIFISAVLFALFHGNIVQIPYAFLVGLILAYTTLEYSIIWAIVLHIFNNFILAEVLERVAQLLPDSVADAVLFVPIIIAAIAAIVVGICCRKEITSYFRNNPFDDTAMRGFIASPGIWVFIVLMTGTAGMLLFL